MPLVKGDDAPLTNPSRRPVKPQTPAPDPLRRGNIALLAVLEGLPDATVGADPRRADRVRQRARRGAVRLRPRGAARAADRDPVARARARALQAQPRALLRARASAALHRARLRAAQGRHRVHRRDELGDRRRATTARCCSRSAATSPSGWRPRRGCGGSPSSRRWSPRSASARCAAWSRATSSTRRRSGSRPCSAPTASRCSRARARSPPGARSSAAPARSACRSTPAIGCTARWWRTRRARRRSATRRARSCRRSPTCWRSASRA